MHTHAHEHGAEGLCPPQLAAIRATRTHSLGTDGEAGVEEVKGAEPECGRRLRRIRYKLRERDAARQQTTRWELEKETARNTKEAGENKRRREARRRGSSAAVAGARGPSGGRLWFTT